MAAEGQLRRRRGAALLLGFAILAVHGIPAARALEYQGEGHGIPVPPYPSAGAIAAAARFLDSRAGATAFAVVDSQGKESGARLHEHFRTASVVKAMMLVAYLQMRSAQHRALNA